MLVTLTQTPNGIKIEGINWFDIAKSLNCGQCFRAKPLDGGYIFVAQNRVIFLRQENGAVNIDNATPDEFETVWLPFFDLHRDYTQVAGQLAAGDGIMAQACEYGHGIRIFAQDLWETIISFIISANNHIPRIKGIIERLCEGFGDRIEWNGCAYYAFPSPRQLQNITEQDLAPLRAGFRTKYIMDAVRQVNAGGIHFDLVRTAPYEQAKAELMKIKGIGSKVANCILLFGAGRFEAFPVDVWVRRMLHNYYGDQDYDPNQFGEYAGFAQQMLFYYGRENKIRDTG